MAGAYGLRLRAQGQLGGLEAVRLRHRGLAPLPAFAARDVHVFSQLDVALGAEDGEPPVAPGRKAIGRVPVDAKISVPLRAPQEHLSEVLEARVGGVREVADRARDDFRIARASEVQKLV